MTTIKLLEVLKMKIFNRVKGFTQNKVAEVKQDFAPNTELTVAEREQRTHRAVNKITAGICAVMMATSAMGVTCFADTGTDTFNNVVSFIVDWVARIGLVIGFIGAVQFAMGFKDDNADGKTRGLLCLASGFIVFAVAKAYDTLFVV
jgi:hypothetical protein